ncbi:replicative DNA helicase [Hymenobacter busanensis]|uniref:Replicative DNA helicase n=2 Tax=Hymenobacter busanensis TaxID=2607656 RepID=A0A7L4ZTD7_9BACT|nr:replicative DNA helicase [Hymenobacter busanensis]KAA9327586.1 replicative DNA helicase [Hymenobacter busanensis]QHJ06075.1 replicative DNA helicase [Hymenobacter busanensis]
MMDESNSRVKQLAARAQTAWKSKPVFPTSPTGKLPPQARELEAAVLGALMLEKDALTTVIDILKPQSFYDDRHQRIFQAILGLFDKSEPIDILTVTQELRERGELEAAGGPPYVAQLTFKVNSAANVEYHARIITENAIKRELIRIASDIQREAFEDTTDVFNLLDQTEQSLFEVSESNIRKNFDDMRSLMGKAIKELEEKKNQKDGLTGVPSGFTALDRVTSGWQPSDLVIIAARPGMGKTAFVVSAMRNAAVEFKKPVAIFSLEMSSIQLVNRLISAEAELDSEKIKKGNLADYEWAQLNHKIASLSAAPIFIDDTPALSIRELRTKCRRLKAHHDIQMIIIDYLQLMTGNSDGGKGAGNREQEIASISRALKGIAKELNVPVLALSQLSRSVETRGGDKRPQLSDLRESGSIEQDADMVIFLYRPEYYKITEDEMGNPTQGMGEVIIAKHRNGSLENVQLKFIGRFTKFGDLDGGGGFDDAGMSYNTGQLPPSNFDEPDPGFAPNTIRLGSRMNDAPPPPQPFPRSNFANEDPPF